MTTDSHPASCSPPFRSLLAFSVQNEDYRSEQAVLQRLPMSRPLRILMIASSGENALSLLCDPRVGHIDAIDINPAQIHLVALRIAALKTLTRDEQLRLFGAHPAFERAGDAVERLALYARLRPHLPDDARAFWDARTGQEIAFGIQHVGANDNAMHDIQARLRAQGMVPFEQSLNPEDEARWIGVYEDVLTPDYVGAMFNIQDMVVRRKFAGLAARLGREHFRALRQPRAEHNPFVTTALANRYAQAAGDAGLPLYLQADGQAALLEHGVHARLDLHTGNALEWMGTLGGAGGGYDLISLSNIADWMTEAQFAATVESALRALCPGGALLARTLTGSPMIITVVAQHMGMDDHLQVSLPTIERGPWFRTLAVGFRA